MARSCAKNRLFWHAKKAPCQKVPVFVPFFKNSCQKCRFSVPLSKKWDWSMKRRHFLKKSALQRKTKRKKFFQRKIASYTVASRELVRQVPNLRDTPNPILKKEGNMMKEKSTRMYLRVSSQEKEKIDGLAKSCGLSTAEYIRRRALGFVPRASVPDSFYGFNAKLCKLLNRDLSPAIETAALQLFDEIHGAISEQPKQTTAQIRKEAAQWQAQDSGRSSQG